MKKRIFALAALAVVCGSSLALSAELFSREKYESASYKVVKNEGAFEIRKYPELVVVSAPMSKGSEKNNAFRSLFQYISGKNEAGKKIAMTTPVFTTPKAEGAGVMSFVVPAEVAKAGAPKANSEAVEVAKRAAGKFAVYRYSGRWTKAREAEAQKRLEAWIKKEGLEAVGSVEKANYDPPFTPGFLRRNEALVRISG
jgi:hypothetical protein